MLFAVKIIRQYVPDAFEAALGLVAVSLFTGDDFKVKGGRGRIRNWAVAQAALLRGMVSYLVRLEGRTEVARHPKIQVLKRILHLQRANAPPALPAPSVIEAPVASAEVALGHEEAAPAVEAGALGEDSLILGAETQEMSFEEAVIGVEEFLAAETFHEVGDSVAEPHDVSLLG